MTRILGRKPPLIPDQQPAKNPAVSLTKTNNRAVGQASKAPHDERPRRASDGAAAVASPARDPLARWSVAICPSEHPNADEATPTGIRAKIWLPGVRYPLQTCSPED